MITKATRDRQRADATARDRELAELARVRYLLDILLLSTIGPRVGYVQCLHCRATASLNQAIPHAPNCVVGQILQIRQQEKL